MVSVYINNGDINNLVFDTQIDIGDDASPTILSNGSIIVGNEVGDLKLLYYDSGNLTEEDMPETPYCGQYLTPFALSDNNSQEFENLLVGSKAGGLQYLSYNTLSIKNGNDLPPQDFKISAVYPNPNNGQCKIDISINNAANYKISLIDINGRVINNIFDSRLNKGKYTFTINEIRSSGVYFIKLEKDDLFVIKKFVRLK